MPSTISSHDNLHSSNAASYFASPPSSPSARSTLVHHTWGSNYSGFASPPSPTKQIFGDNVSQYSFVLNNEAKQSPATRSFYSGRPSLTHIQRPSNSRPQHLRSLTVSTTFSDSSASSSDSEMATETITSPGSPPELSSSRSSNKSSSLRSSSVPGDEEDDIGHFEDISLAAPRRLASGRAPIDRPNKPRQLLRTTTAPVPTQHNPRKLVPSPTNPRPAKDGLRTTVTVNNGMRTLNGQRSPVKANGLPMHSASSLAIPQRPSRRRTSDQRFPAGRVPPPHRSATSPIIPQHADAGPFLPMKRSPSAAGKRRSAKEIEAEFDALNDADEEVPDDAIITNIPLSPRPPLRSPSISPDRQLSSPQSDGGLDFGRARSWDSVLAGLSPEERDLSDKLHQLGHKDEYLIRRNSAETPSSQSPSRPGLKHAKSTTFTLPPVQGPNPLVDPAPISKEKEKLLTRTRPSHLPPKSKAEEKKHIKEYLRMMECFAEKEKRMSADSQKTNSSQRSSKDRVAIEGPLRAWRSILGDWDQSMGLPGTREKWWTGVPAALRAQVWSRAIRNDLQLSARSYSAALERAEAVVKTLDTATTEPKKMSHTRQASTSESKAHARARRSMAAMEQDIDTGAFPQLGLFQKGQSRYQDLRRLLLAYGSYREDTGHVRGTAGIAALILLQHMPVEHDRSVPEAAVAEAFITLANLLNRQMSIAFCINEPAGKEHLIKKVEKMMKVKLPRLHEHFGSLLARRRSNPDIHSPQTKESQPLVDVTPILRDIVHPLACSLMTTALTADEAARFMDVLVFEGDGVMVRGIVGLLRRCESSLYGSKEEVNRVLGWQSMCGAPNGKGADDFIEFVRWAGREGAECHR